MSDNIKPESEHLQGYCPRCEAPLWNVYGKEVFDGEGLYFPYKCEHCGFEGKENYALQFTNHS